MSTDIIIILGVLLLIVLIVAFFRRTRRLHAAVNTSNTQKKTLTQATSDGSTKCYVAHTEMASVMKVISIAMLAISLLAILAAFWGGEFKPILFIVGILSSAIVFCLYYSIGVILDMLNVQSAILAKLLDKQQ